MSLNKILKRVQKPARYIGNEYGSVHKKRGGWKNSKKGYLRGGNEPFGYENSLPPFK